MNEQDRPAGAGRDHPAIARIAATGPGAAARPRRRVAVWILAAGALLVVFLALGVAVRVGWTPQRGIDAAVEPAAHRVVLADPALLTAARVVSDLGSPVAMNLVTVIAMLALALSRRIRPAVYIAAVRLVELGVETVAKAVVDRPRPVWADPVAFGSSSSFPSGHSAGTAAVVVALLVLGTVSVGRPRTTTRRLAALVGVVAGAALLVAVPVSRVLLGVHYPVDVTAGLALGTACALGLRPLLLPPIVVTTAETEPVGATPPDSAHLRDSPHPPDPNASPSASPSARPSPPGGTRP